MKKKLVNSVIVFSTIFLFLVPLVFAETTADIALITEPLNKIYDLIKAVVSVVAVIAITFAGAKFMFSGDNLPARDGAKSMVTYAIAGLVVVWIAPVVVNFLTAPIPTV